MKNERLSRRDLLRKGPLALFGVGAAAVLPQEKNVKIDGAQVPAGASIVIHGNGTVMNSTFTLDKGPAIKFEPKR